MGLKRDTPPYGSSNPHALQEHRPRLCAGHPTHAHAQKPVGILLIRACVVFALLPDSWSTPSSLLLFALSETKMMGWREKGSEGAGKENKNYWLSGHEATSLLEQLCLVRSKGRAGTLANLCSSSISATNKLCDLRKDAQSLWT